ncbi:anti-sigma factor [Phycicoccus sp. BSK3Z-2]|uniref:Regulator of SigK n=1 Tax=Phycicoccus avicenniae TaxID=2828860 RepID=A0A941I193_9MICO|nr:anti-sigma factor [Phycicoccus avicenniae]MBR7744695.1 anti-sigma factor [Phycicoccus avicenniae]
MSPDLHHLSGAYAVDALDTDERSAFEQHLSLCSACQSDVHELTEAAHALAALTEAAPPASLRTAVLAGIGQVRPLPPLVVDDAAQPVGGDASTAPTHDEPEPVAGEGAAVARHAKVVPLFRRRTTWIAAAAAAAVLAVGGVGVDAWTSQEPELTAVQEVQQAPDSSTVTSSRGELSAELTYSRELGRSAISMTGVPPAPDGMTYQLWYVGTDEVARSAGFIEPDDGRGQSVLEGDLSRAAAVGVTVEPAGGSDAPTTEPIVVLALG